MALHHRHACALVRREGLQIDGPAPDFRGTSRSTRDGLLAEFRRAAVLRPGRRRRRERHGQQQAGCDLHGGSVALAHRPADACRSRSRPSPCSPDLENE